MSATCAGARLAIICAYWPVHRTVIYIARELARCGMSVDLLLYQAQTDDSLTLLEGLPVNVFHLDREAEVGRPTYSGRRHLAGRALCKAKRLLQVAALNLAPYRTLFSKAATAEVEDLLRGQSYRFVLAVEKGALALVAKAMAENAPPLLYYSLELYTRDHPLVRNDPTFAALWRLECQYAPKVSVFAIQDELRWHALRADLGLGEQTKVVFLPVSELEQHPNVQPSSFLRQLLAVSSEQKILLYFGVIRAERGSIALASVADRLPEGWLLVFHGPCNENTRNKILAQSQHGRIRISSTYVPSSMREELVGSADIGLAIYAEQPANDRLTGFASEKVALYLKCGVPVIGRNTATYDHLWAEGAGIPVSALEEIVEAVHRISCDYPAYRARARAAFSMHYAFERNFRRVKDAITAALAQRD